MERLRKAQILKDLNSKIVFLTGPRQVGKTWLARDIAKEFSNSVYLNYDSQSDREIIKKEAWLGSTDLLILDEIHKMPEWKTYIKGIYDTKPEHLKILVTGSARLEYIRQTGDSLSGRFFRHRLFPFSLGELAVIDEKSLDKNQGIDRLMYRGGFPEPFLAPEESFARRWRSQYVDGLIREDVLDFEKFHDFKSLKLCLELLQSRVGSPVSYTSIASDIGIAPNTVKKYIQIFEELYIIFRVMPFSDNIARSILKEPKFYFYDNGLVNGDEGIRFENITALSLFTKTAAEADLEGFSDALHYVRTKDGKEVDFCYVRNGDIRYLLEVKLSDSDISKPLFYFCEKYDLPGIQLVKNLKHERRIKLLKQNSIEVRSAEKWLAKL